MNMQDDSYSETEALLPEAHVLDAEGLPDLPEEAGPTQAGSGSGGGSDLEGGTSGETDAGAAPQPRSRHALREIVETVVVTLLIFLVVRAVIQNFRVDGDSMLPTLHSDQYLLVNKGLYFRYDANFVSRIFNPNVAPDMRYLFHGPQRGDIVVFASPTEPLDFIKRVIATEGETVQIKADPDSIGKPGEPCGGCGVYVDGALLSEPYVKATSNYDVGPIVVPAGDVYVLGDNRRNSSDSHEWGPLDVNRIVGVAFLSYWPTTEWGLLSHPTYAQSGK